MYSVECTSMPLRVTCMLVYIHVFSMALQVITRGYYSKLPASNFLENYMEGTLSGCSCLYFRLTPESSGVCALCTVLVGMW